PKGRSPAGAGSHENAEHGLCAGRREGHAQAGASGADGGCERTAAGHRIVEEPPLAAPPTRPWTTGGSIGYPRSIQASKPPRSGRTRVIPHFLSCSATRALVASFGQEQYNTRSRSRGIS